MRNRLVVFLASLPLLAAGGCGRPSALEHEDLASPPAPSDLSIPWPPRDSGGPAPTGAECKASSDCAPSMAPGTPRGMCVKGQGSIGSMGVVWPHGYCTAPCRPTKNDVDGINSADCSGEYPVCVGPAGGSGYCYTGCTSVNDCRDEYVCANIGTPMAACVPQLASDCDPPNDPRPNMKHCAPGQRCVNYSPDNSYGGCAWICDPVAQDCPVAMQGVYGCIVDVVANDGSGNCLSVNEPSGEGNHCMALGECGAGAMCFGQVCRLYCRTGGKPCPQDLTCRNIEFPGVKFTAETTGLCLP